MADAARRASAHYVNAVIPYFGYARQDRKAKPREPITAKLVANILAHGGIDRVVTADLHTGQIQGFFDIPVDHLTGMKLMAGYFKKLFEKELAEHKVVVVSPDAGGVARARKFAMMLNTDIAIVDKRRSYDEANKSEVMDIVGNIKGRVAILVDDIIDTAGTICYAAKGLKDRGSLPFNILLEEAHRYIQSDTDTFILGYNIFDRIAKEGRKYGIILSLISQRPVDISDTVIAQCANFLIFKMNHPRDLDYIQKMVPNISEEIIEKLKTLQPGTCMAFGTAFRIPMIVRMDMPSPAPKSANVDVYNKWTT